MTEGISSSGKPTRYMKPSPRADAKPNRPSGLDLLRLQNLPALILAGLEVDMVRPAQLAGILVLDISRFLQGIGGTAHPATGGRGFSFWNGHCSISSNGRRRRARKGPSVG